MELSFTSQTWEHGTENRQLYSHLVMERVDSLTKIAKAETVHQTKESICIKKGSRLMADWLKCCTVLAVCTEGSNRSRYQREMCSQEAYSLRRQRKGMLKASRYPSQISIFPFVWEKLKEIKEITVSGRWQEQKRHQLYPCSDNKTPCTAILNSCHFQTGITLQVYQ